MVFLGNKARISITETRSKLISIFPAKEEEQMEAQKKMMNSSEAIITKIQ